MADKSADKSSKKPEKKVRKLRPASETVRERTHSAEQVSRAHKSGKVRGFFARIGGLKIWKPFKAVGRFLSRFLIPPYFKNSWRELQMVTWPGRRETRRLTVAVIIFSIVFGITVALVDFLLDKLFKKVILNI